MNIKAVFVRHSSSSLLAILGVCLLTFSYYPNLSLSTVTGDAQLTLALLAYATLGVYGVKDRITWTSLYLALYLLAMSGLFWNGMRSLYLVLLWMPAIFLTCSTVHKGTIEFISRAVFIVGAGLGAASILQISLEAFGLPSGLGGFYDSSVFGFGRARMFFEEPQFLGSFLLLSLSAGVGIKGHKNRDIGIVLVVVGLGLTLSRGAMLAALMGSILYLILLVRQGVASFNENNRLIAAVISGAFIALVVVSMAGFIGSGYKISPIEYGRSYINHLIDRPTNNPGRALLMRPRSQVHSGPAIAGSATGRSSAASRLDSSSDAIAIFKEAPLVNKILGHGPAGFDSVMRAKYGEPSTGRGYVTNNLYASLLVEYGLIGLAGLVGLLAYAAISLYKRVIGLSSKVDTVLLIALASGLTQYMFFSSVANSLHFWILLGLIIAYLRNEAKGKTKSLPGLNAITVAITDRLKSV